MATNVNRDSIPNTDSIEELARFWDTHSLADYEDEIDEVVEVTFELPRNAALSLHKLAQSKEIRERDLVREWVLEKLSDKGDESDAKATHRA